MATNTLYVVQGHEHPWLLSETLLAGNVSWVSGTAPEAGVHIAAKTRYRQADAACRFTPAGVAGAFALTFEMPQWAVTPGQSAVLYDGDVCLGGGIIEAARSDERAAQALAHTSGNAAVAQLHAR